MSTTFSAKEPALGYYYQIILLHKQQIGGSGEPPKYFYLNNLNDLTEG